MGDIFANEDREAVLITESRKCIYLHQSKCNNAIIGGGEILSKEGTIQDDSTAIGGYALGVLPLIHFLLEFISLNHLVLKEVVFADDFTTSLILKTTGEN